MKVGVRFKVCHTTTDNAGVKRYVILGVSARREPNVTVYSAVVGPFLIMVAV